MPPTPKPDRNQTVNRLRQHDLRHYRTTDRYARDVQRLYDEAVKDFTELAGTIFAPDPNAPFTFADHPRAKREAARLAVELTKNVQHVIEAGQRSQWIAATYRANDYLGAIINRSKLTPDELKQYEDRNLEGLAAFQGRKVQGLNLSERVWKITDQFTGQMELAIDTTLGQGKSAAELSRDVRNLLNEPNKLFRRVRDKYGNLNLSKAAAAYHPGRGVYRSSAQNAMRLARTEINMAYRTADWERWQNEEHVVGIRIQLSNNHTIKNRKGEDERLIDICDELQGDYPKTFKFVGWHPNCRCTIFPILQRPEEMHEARRARLREIMNGETYKAQPSADLVTDVPESFKKHIEAIAERSKGWASIPYYIRDNFKGGTIAGGLSKAIPHQSSIGGNTGKPYTPPQPCTEFDAQIDDFKNQAYSLGLDVSRLDSLRAAGQREPLKAEIDRLQALSDDRSAQWIAAAGNLRNFIRCCKGAGQAFINKYLDVVKANNYSLKTYYQAAIDALSHAKAEAEKEWQKIKDEEAKAKTEAKDQAAPEVMKIITEAEAIIKGSTLALKVANIVKQESTWNAKDGIYKKIDSVNDFDMQNGLQRDVNIYITPSGVQIVIPRGKNIINTQSFTVEMIAKRIAELPIELKATLKSVYLCDFFNPDDPFWAKQYNTPDFLSFATGGQGVVRFYKNKGDNAKLKKYGLTVGASENRINGTLYHETGHNTDYALSKISSSNAWKQAVAYDKKLTGLDAVTDYGKNAPVEDFADSVKLFVQNRDDLKKRFPARYAILCNIFTSMQK